MTARSYKSLALLIAGLLIASVLTGCGKSTVNVDVHGVNYSGNEFSYLLVDPGNPDSSSAGEHIDRYAAGGTTCCYPLPKQWHPGIKVQLRTTHWVPEQGNSDKLTEVHEDHVVEVPPYVDGKPGELWVLRAADGKVSVVSSVFQPDHPKWPGEPKGWPVPSLEYKREKWAAYKKYEEGGVRLYRSLLADLEKAPQQEAKEAWAHAQKRDPASLKEFSGPDDPRYLVALRNHYLEGLKESRLKLQKVMENRP